MGAQHTIPGHLSVPRQAWLRGLLDDHVFSPREWSLAILAAEAYDRGQTARRQLQREGLTITTRFGEVRAHPCVAIARDSTNVFSRLLAQLELDEEPESEVID